MHLPCYISIAVLTVLLILNEWSHRRTEKVLINRILEQRGIEPIPESHPLAETLSELTRPSALETMQKELARRGKRHIRMPQENISFKIPGIELPKVK